MGRTPNLLNLQGKLLRQLTGAAPGFTSKQEGKDALRQALEGRPLPVVLDDVWNGDHAVVFAFTAPRSQDTTVFCVVTNLAGSIAVTARKSEALFGRASAWRIAPDLIGKESGSAMCRISGTRGRIGKRLTRFLETFKPGRLPSLQLGNL